MLLPGQDPVTMLFMMAPLIVLYEGSILLASLLDRRSAAPAPAKRPRWPPRTTPSCLPLDPDDD